MQISTLESMIAYNNDFEPKSDNSRLIERMEAAKVAISALEELEAEIQKLKQKYEIATPP